MSAARQLLVDFLRAIIKVEPMKRQDLVDEYEKRLDSLIAEIKVS